MRKWTKKEGKQGARWQTGGGSQSTNQQEANAAEELQRKKPGKRQQRLSG
jgi:hypothetical protein